MLLVSLNPEFRSVLLYDQSCWSYRPLWETCTERPHMILNTTWSNVYLLLLSPSPRISLRFDQRPAVSNAGHFETSAPDDPKMTLNTTRPMVAHTCYYCPWIPNFSPFHSKTSHFRVTGDFQTSVLNDPKMALKPTRSKVPHMCVTNVPKSQISPQFPLLPTIFAIQVADNHTRKEWNDTRMTWTLKQSKVPCVH